MHLVLLLVIIICAYAQIEGPNLQGETFFFFNNYSGVFILQKPKPSAIFHPVLGGPEIKYIRKENFFEMNWGSLDELDSARKVVAHVSPLDLEWQFNSTTVEESSTNVHYAVTLSAQAPNGALLEVIAESWSRGISRPYGNYINVVPASCIEFSFKVTNWPFKSQSNRFDLTVLLKLDGNINAIPDIDTTNPMQYHGTIATANTSFSMSLMTNVILDSESTDLLGYSLLPPSFADLSTLALVFKSPSFSKSFLYDPNFSALIYNSPDCSPLGDCGNGGVCVEANQCKCKAGFSGQNCSSEEEKLTDDAERNKISPSVYIGVGVGAVLGVAVITVGIMVWYSHFLNKRPTSMINVMRRTTLTGANNHNMMPTLLANRTAANDDVIGTNDDVNGANDDVITTNHDETCVNLPN